MESDCKIIKIVLRDRKSLQKPVEEKSNSQVSMQASPFKERQKWPAGSITTKEEGKSAVYPRPSPGAKAMKDLSGEVSDKVEAERQQSKAEKTARTEQTCECYSTLHTDKKGRPKDSPRGSRACPSFLISPRVLNSDIANRYNSGNLGQPEVIPHCQATDIEDFRTTHLQPFGTSGEALADMATPRSGNWQHEAGRS
eukprot:4424228-Amphidinium_carterae.1